MPGTTALPNARLIDAHIRFSRKHDTLIKLAGDYGGACTKKFAQEAATPDRGMASFYDGRVDRFGKWNGVCKALVTFWISHHARDTSFWDWLMTDAGITSVSVGTIIASVQSSYREAYMSAPASRRDEADEAWCNRILGSQGIIPMTMITNKGRPNRDGATLKSSGRLSAPSSFAFGVGAMLTAAIAPAKMYAGRYTMIRISRSEGGGHVMCGWFAQDVCFFDPNVGEFWFETRRGFQMWFPQFWNLTYGPAGYDGDFHVRSYGRQIGS